MIIWGTRGREIYERSGSFHCPRCEADQRYDVIRVATYFTLYFIPLFETQSHGHYVKCVGCKGQFKPEVLRVRRPAVNQRPSHSIRDDLDSGMPIELIRTKLASAGVDAESAEKIIAPEIGDKVNRCEGCNLTFHHKIPRCSYCGGRF